MLRTTDRGVHLHVFGSDADEIDRMLAFRDTLRTDRSARQRYEQVKRDLAARQWPTMQQYADAKSDIIDDLLRDTGAAISESSRVTHAGTAAVHGVARRRQGHVRLAPALRWPTSSGRADGDARSNPGRACGGPFM